MCWCCGVEGAITPGPHYGAMGPKNRPGLALRREQLLGVGAKDPAPTVSVMRVVRVVKDIRDVSPTGRNRSWMIDTTSALPWGYGTSTTDGGPPLVGLTAAEENVGTAQRAASDQGRSGR
jgi:hypothetical protein